MYQNLSPPVKYREDINGLRAWAVVAVLLYHFSSIGLPGGFIGVDVFFVISGYLMTAIIIKGYETEKFSIWTFYLARARRILPALLVLVLVLFIFGWFWLPIPDYKSLGIQSAYSLSFLSNFHYWNSAGYFDSFADEKWLLHTWTLAVEAQFYFLYPIFIALIWRHCKSYKVLTLSLITLLFASLTLNIYFSWKDPVSAFYLLPMRVWELSSGALVFLFSKKFALSKKWSEYLYVISWTVLILSFFLVNEYLIWPGGWAIIPVLSTSIIVFTCRERGFLTNNIFAQWLGDRSYSLYLWHWPLVVCLYFFNLKKFF